jgi:hypothetical protein
LEWHIPIASCDNKGVRNVRTFLDLLLGVDGLLFFLLLLFLLFLFLFLVVLGVGLGSLLNQDKSVPIRINFNHRQPAIAPFPGGSQWPE